MKHIGKQTVKFANPPSILAEAAVVGKKEGEGPLAHCFDKIEDDAHLGQETWEKAEAQLLKETFTTAMDKGGVTPQDIDYALSGDLLNQCVSAHFGLRDLNIPFLGLYGACSTMAESMMVGSFLIDGEFAQKVLAGTSSHFCSAERQFRFPLEYGGQRTPTAQWTVTGSGCTLLGTSTQPPYITHVTTGKIVDMGIKDLNNMGAAMAPALVDTLCAHFSDTGRQPEYYDLIVSGDLGIFGRQIAIDLMREQGYEIENNYNDCGCMIFDPETQDTHGGGSGCGCSGSVLCGHILKEIRKGTYQKVLFVATGALMSPTTSFQGESIPGIAHAVAIENEKNAN